MALTVEDGTNIAGADSFVSLADANTYHDSKGNSTWTGDDADKESALRRATAVLDGYSWQGRRSHDREQSLSWPRATVYDRELNAIDADEIPQELKDALCELALRELTTPGQLSPDVVLADKVRSEKVGDLAIEYANVSTNANASIPIIPVVNRLIGPFLTVGAGSLVGASFRR